MKRYFVIISLLVLSFVLFGANKAIAGTATVSWNVIFTKNLYLGVKDIQVQKLQEFLSKDKTVYPEGTITGYFGLLTKKAVQRFQCKYNLICSGAAFTNGYGMVGPRTRMKLNELYAGVSQTEEELTVQLQTQIKVLQEKILQLMEQINQLLKQKAIAQ